MPVYCYRALSANGKVIEGSAFAENAKALMEELKQQSLLLISTSPLMPWWSKLLSASCSWQQTANLFNDLNHLLESHIPLVKAINILGNLNTSSKIKAALLFLESCLKQGTPFSKAVRSTFHGVLAPEIVELLAATENIEDLPLLLKHLSQYARWQNEFEQKRKNALRYPLILLGVILGLIWTMGELVLPNLQGFILNNEKPNENLVAINTFWNSYDIGTYYPLLCASIFILLSIPKLRASLLQYIKPIYQIAHTIELIRFLNLYVAALKGARSEERALFTLQKNELFPILKQSLSKIHSAVVKGENLSQAMKHADTFPPQVIEITALGEASGNLETVLENLAQIYENALNQKITLLLSWTQPILIIIMGIVMLLLAKITVTPLYENLANLPF